MAAAFEVPPWEVEEQDELATFRVLEAMIAKRAVDAFNAKDKMSATLTSSFERLLDALDFYDESMGIEDDEE